MKRFIRICIQVTVRGLKGFCFTCWLAPLDPLDATAEKNTGLVLYSTCPQAEEDGWHAWKPRRGSQSRRHRPLSPNGDFSRGDRNYGLYPNRGGKRGEAC